MNRVELIGRLTKSPDVRYTTNKDGGQVCVARYTLAVDRRGDGTDYISCVAFGKQGEFAEKYLNKGMKIGASGRIQTGSYTNKDGNKVYTTDVVVEEHDFCEKKGESAPPDSEGFVDVPDGIENDLPFK